MLGFGPVSSRSISGGPFSLIAIPATLSATLSLSFAVSGRIGLFSSLSANVGFGFSVSAFLSNRQALSATATLVFGGDSNLRVAGKPIILSAVPISFTVRVPPASYTLKADHEQFTVRGVR